MYHCFCQVLIFRHYLGLSVSFIIWINNNFWLDSVILSHLRILYKKRCVLEVTTFEGFIVHEFCCSRSDLEACLSIICRMYYHLSCQNVNLTSWYKSVQKDYLRSNIIIAVVVNAINKLLTLPITQLSDKIWKNNKVFPETRFSID